MAIFQLIYSSTATNILSVQQLDRLVAQARIHNFSQAITGVLFCAGQQFLQVLEGEQRVVEQLYDHISQDPRHTNLQVMLDTPVPARLFPNWSMGFGQVANLALARLAGYLHPQHRAALLPSTHNAQEIITDLLQEFIEEQLMSPSQPRSSATGR